MRKLIPALLTLAMLQACANVRSLEPTPAELSQFHAGLSAVIVVNLKPSSDCNEGVMLAIHQAGAPKNELIDSDGARPVVMVVPPGNYKIANALCFKSGFQPFPLKTLPLWFGSVDVKAGEVVYLGTLEITLLDYKQAKTVLQKMLFADNDVWYASFHFDDESADVTERLRTKHPDLAEKMTVRSPRQYITRESFTAALDRAYAPNSDGSLPTPEQAHARLTEELEKVIAEMQNRIRNGARATDLH